MPYDSDARPRALRRAHRHHDRRLLCHLGRDGGGARRLPAATTENAATCCASSATTAAPRMARPTATRACNTTRCRSTTPPAVSTRTASARRRTPRRAWDAALELGEKHGYRNAQATVIAPTGTIGLVMDCDTTGIEPDFALVKFKKLAGGGYFKIINRAVPDALRTLGYGEAEIAEIEAYAVGHGSLGQAPAINAATLKARGLHRREDRGGREGPEGRLRHQVRVQPLDARRGLPDATRSASRPRSSTTRRSRSCPSSASRRPTSRPRTSMSAAR